MMKNLSINEHKRIIILLVIVAITLSVVIGATLAYVTTTTPLLFNTFTIGHVNVELSETPREYIMVPGGVIKKDPTVTIKKGSGHSWVFVKVEENSKLISYIDYEVDKDNWTQLLDEEGTRMENIYYRFQPSVKDKDLKYNVLKDNKVRVKSEIGKADLEELENDNDYPILAFNAYAIQRSGLDDPYQAWKIIRDQIN